MNTRIEITRDRIERSRREATAIIEAERKARVEKTDRLRAMRLGQNPHDRPTLEKKQGSLMAKQTRVVFNSSLTRDGWMVTSGGEPVSNHETQKESEAAAIAAARQVYKDGGLGQAVLHKANGSDPGRAYLWQRPRKEREAEPDARIAITDECNRALKKLSTKPELLPAGLRWTR